LNQLQGYNAAGTIRQIEKSNDFIGNRNNDLPACSIVPQQTTLPRAPHSSQTGGKKKYNETIYQLFIDFKETYYSIVQIGGKFCTIFSLNFGAPEIN
jgi:hypothetical protein